MKKTGAPAKFETPEELEKLVNDYIENPPTKTIVANGQEFEIPCITISGAALHFGFESRQSLYDYEKREGFSYIIKRLRLFVESNYEANLHAPGCTGSIFALKNMGWSDKQELDHTSSDGSMRPTTVQLVAPDDHSKD